MLRIEIVQVTPFEQNCRILYTDAAKAAIVVDPGGAVDRILGRLSSLDLVCEQIWLTHAHLDHAGGVAALIRATKAKLIGHKVEEQMRASIEQVASRYGLADFENCPEPDFFVEDGSCLEQPGGQSWRVLFTPGHSPGHVCFYNEAEAVLLAGDTVFHGSIGRTDLPGGELQTLMLSIRDQILVLPDHVKLMSGHGADTTVGVEKRTNPFLTGGLR